MSNICIYNHATNRHTGRSVKQYPKLIQEDMGMKPHIAMFPSPGIGHSTPFLELAKRLVMDHGFRVSVLVITTTEASSAQRKLLTATSATLPSDLRIINLPPVDVSKILIPDSQLILTRISLIVRESIRFLIPALAQLARVDALIIDMFGTDVFGELQIPVCSFFTTSAWTLALCLYLPKLDQDVTGEFADLRVPGCAAVRGDDLIDQLKNRTTTDYEWLLLHMSRMSMAESIIVNSWEGLEDGTLSALDGFGARVPPVHAIGPVVRGGEVLLAEPQAIELMKWLDDQPVGSVLFVSFGSGGTLSRGQITELAYGLEMSQQRFVWVVHEAQDDTASGTFFNAGEKGSGHEYLPDGFLERTRGSGRVVHAWAPQMAVLKHRSTRAFLSHCGWNSALESIMNGVPMIGWPLYAEQRMNAALLSEEIKVAVRPAVEAGKRTVSREEVERVVRLVMEGKDLERRVEEVKRSALKAVDHGGTSSHSLSVLAEKWRKKSDS